MRSPSAPSIRHDLVLVGGGHAHIQVLKRWAMAPVPGARLTVVVDRPIAVYSGMVPGFVAGQYPRDALEIDVRPLALRAGARCIVAAATGVDPTARRLVLDGRPPIAYDTVSFDVGSTIAGLEIPGAREHAIPTPPIGEVVRPVDEVLGAARGTRTGCGAAGARVEAGALHLVGGERIAADATVWVTGAAALPIFSESGLETDARGFVRIRPSLQCRGHDDVFAVGDCAAWTAGRPLAKAGVVAERQGAAHA